jgi:hypothetical protein
MRKIMAKVSVYHFKEGSKTSELMATRETIEKLKPVIGETITAEIIIESTKREVDENLVKDGFYTPTFDDGSTFDS